MTEEAIWLIELQAFGEKDYSQKKDKEKQGSRRSSGWLQEAETISNSESQQSDIKTPIDEQAASNTIKDVKKKRKTVLERHAALLDIIYNFLNSNCCLQSILLEFFKEALANLTTKVPFLLSEQCCSYCNSKILCFTLFSTLPKLVCILRNLPKLYVLADINAQCKDKVKKLIPSSKF